MNYLASALIVITLLILAFLLILANQFVWAAIFLLMILLVRIPGRP